MKENWEKSFNLMLASEGLGVRKDNPWGFVNDPNDPGGMTQLGVTKRAWEEWVGHNVTEKDMRALRPETVKPFYRAKYWDKVKGDQLPAGIDYATFDMAVNSGVSRAIKYLQQIAGVPADGILGSKSLDAIQSCDPQQTVNALCDMRIEFLKRLPTWGRFGAGWSNRVAKVEQQAANMAQTV